MEKGLLSPETEKMLLKLGMAVPDREAERREVLGLLDEINEKSKSMNVSVIINLDCNFNCVYCYEGGMKGNIHMTPETAGLLLDFIKERFATGKKILNLDFYGGEPLLSAGMIKYISSDLKSFAEDRGASYSFTLVTNGSLLKRRTVEELAPLGLSGVKITIDGPPEVHNSFRPFRSGSGSFDTIIKNIKETCDLIKVAVGGNFQRDNSDKFPRLLDCLEKEGLTPDRLYEVKFDPVMNRSGEGGFLPDYIDGCMSVNDPWVIEAGAMLREKILKRGYNTPKITPAPCMVELKDTYVVHFDGTLYKCPALIGRKGFETGDLRSGVIDYSDSHNLGIWKNEECMECVYLPLCYGGCRYMAYVRDGNVNNIDCRKAYLDASLETLIKQDIKYRPRQKR